MAKKKLAQKNPADGGIFGAAEGFSWGMFEGLFMSH